jgi:hypothetical protein
MPAASASVGRRFGLRQRLALYERSGPTDPAACER